MTSGPETPRDDYENILTTQEFEDFIYPKDDEDQYIFTSLKHVLSIRYAKIKASKTLSCGACE